MSGFLAALWLLGLFAAAPALRAGARYVFADRLRDALFLGVAIPFVLGFVHLLYPVACWCALVLCVAVAYWRRLGEPARSEIDRDHPPYVLIAALVAVAWPQLMRPLLDGDSLSYHLPNAASWVQSHSLWSTATRYWWYPPASELFASGLYAVGSSFALPWSGFAALTLLGFRIVTWARESYAAPPLLADALAAATVTVYPLAIQGGTLQNDVWLAAFWLEALWALRSATNASVATRTLAVTALIKPQGWLLSVVALVAWRAPAKLWFAAGVPLALWLLRDALLWSGATVAPANTATENALGSTILAHGAPAFALLARVALQTSPFAAMAFCAALFGPAVARRQRSLGWSGLGAALLFFVLPFGYNTAVAQLATGASLRFAAPAIAIGVLILAPAACRIVRLATVLLLASTVFGVWSLLMVFWNDGSTHVALAIAALAATFAATSHLWRVAWPYAIAFGIAVLAAVHFAARHPLDYYADALRVGTASPGIYRWIETERPAAIGGWGLRLGVVNVLSPTTRTLDLSDANACVQARRSGVLLAAVAENDRTNDVNAQRLATARACGRATFDDGIGVIASPAAR